MVNFRKSGTYVFDWLFWENSRSILIFDSLRQDNKKEAEILEEFLIECAEAKGQQVKPEIEVAYYPIKVWMSMSEKIPYLLI